MRLLVFLVVVAALQQSVTTAPPTASVAIKTFQFAPDTLRVAAGTRVIWMNQDDIEHTVTAGTPPKLGAAFDAVLRTKGSTIERTFERPGTFTYFCDRHQFMRGTITITR